MNNSTPPKISVRVLKQIAYEAGLWAIDIEELHRLRGTKKPVEHIFKDKFDAWIDERIKLST